MTNSTIKKMRSKKTRKNNQRGGNPFGKSKKSKVANESPDTPQGLLEDIEGAIFKIEYLLKPSNFKESDLPDYKNIKTKLTKLYEIFFLPKVARTDNNIVYSYKGQRELVAL